MHFRSFSLTRIVRYAAFSAALACGSAHLWADADGAKKDLKDAQAAFDNNDAKTAGDDLQLAEAELDGVADDVKTPILNDIKALKQKIADTQGNQAKIDAKKNMDSLMNEARSELDAPGSFDETDKAIQDFLFKDENKAALGDDAVAQYQKTLSTYRKVERSKALAATIASAKDKLDQAEKDWPDKLKQMQNPDTMQSAADDFGHTLDAIDPLVKTLPNNSDDGNALKAQYAKLLTNYQTQIYKSKADETYSRIKDDWESYSDEYKGWDAETTGPTFDFILTHQGDTASKFNAPKTVGLITRANYELDNWMKDDVIHSLSQSEGKVKDFIDRVRGDRKTAMDKVAKFASDILDQAEKAETNQDSRDRLETMANDDLRVALSGSEKLKGLQDRAMKIVRAFDAKTGGDAAAHQKMYDDLIAAGGKAWAAMAAKLQATDEFDPNAVMQNPGNFQGKAFHFKGINNRMGWDYAPGNGYQFAATIEGTPVVGKFDSTVAAAVKDIGKKTAKDLPDDDFEFIATVEDVGPIVKIARATGNIQTTGGETVGTITAQGEETVQGVRLKIVALHSGAVTAAEDQGEVNADGTIGQPAQ